jgi:DNA-directed RNA polymerase specialized sigma24 family protein
MTTGADVPFGDRLVRLHDQTKIVLLRNAPAEASPVPERQIQRRLSPGERVALVQAYQRGSTMHELAEQFGVHDITVSKCLHDLAVPLRRQSLSAAQRDEAVQLYVAGWSMNRIGEKLGCAHTTIRNVLVEEGVPRRDSHGRER